MTTQSLQDNITAWIRDYAEKASINTLVVGISGGIDSAVVSALCARTGLDVVAVTMPIRQRPEQHDLSVRQGVWLTENFANVKHVTIDLTSTFDDFESKFSEHNSVLGFANSRSRLRMVTLYQISQSLSGLVVGTGNRVEDFGVGFYTKYGDGGVDISPIADCLKTQVWQMGRELGVLQVIIDASPTDGLWDDARTDQDQLGGLTYAQLELAMYQDHNQIQPDSADQQATLSRYQTIRAGNLHKMVPIPVYKNI